MAIRDRRRSQDGPLTLEEIIARFRGEGVLMRVTEHDEDHWPAKGYLMAHASSQQAILEDQERAPRATVGQPYYTCFAQPDITSGAEYEEAVQRFVCELIMAT